GNSADAFHLVAIVGHFIGGHALDPEVALDTRYIDRAFKRPLGSRTASGRSHAFCDRKEHLAFVVGNSERLGMDESLAAGGVIGDLEPERLRLAAVEALHR